MLLVYCIRWPKFYKRAILIICIILICGPECHKIIIWLYWRVHFEFCKSIEVNCPIFDYKILHLKHFEVVSRQKGLFTLVLEYTHLLITWYTTIVKNAYTSVLLYNLKLDTFNVHCCIPFHFNINLSFQVPTYRSGLDYFLFIFLLLYKYYNNKS